MLLGKSHELRKSTHRLLKWAERKFKDIVGEPYCGQDLKFRRTPGFLPSSRNRRTRITPGSYAV
jgi:hypothetical protein